MSNFFGSDSGWRKNVCLELMQSANSNCICAEDTDLGICNRLSQYDTSLKKTQGGKYLLGTLRSNDADGNENVKKTIGLISKTTTSHVHHTFLYISFPFLHDYDVKMPNFALYGGRKQATAKFYFSFRGWLWPASGGFVYN